jgi:hypothetical protein
VFSKPPYCTFNATPELVRKLKKTKAGGRQMAAAV